ncbi:MAG: hypothetical protein COB15_16960 [Flavobacteriales bacterium]|nr:MAG: hypothetical protein COB15_16960 [Flavobacteriales bacterium]
MILLCLNSCQSKLTEAELKTYIQNPENGLMQEKKVNNVEYKLIYKPTALMINQELRNKEITNGLLDSLEEKYSKHHYFMLSVNVNNRDILSSKAGNKGEFGSAVYQLSFNMNEKTFLVNDNLDTLGLVDYVFPRMYGMSPATNMLFVFEKGDWEHTKSLKLHINEFGLNTGNTKYKFLAKDIKNIPAIKYKEV